MLRSIIGVAARFAGTYGPKVADEVCGTEDTLSWKEYYIAEREIARQTKPAKLDKNSDEFKAKVRAHAEATGRTLPSDY